MIKLINYLRSELKIGKIIKYLGLWSLIVSLVGCGFKLRSNYKLPAEFKYLVIEYNGNQDHPIYVQLLAELPNFGAVLLTKEALKNAKFKEPAVKILSVEIPSINEQVHSYDSKGQISGDRITAKCDYKILDREHKLLTAKTIIRTYTYSVDPNKSLANYSEKQSIIKQLNVEIIQELIDQLVFSSAEALKPRASE